MLVELLVLLVAGVSDVRTREVDDRVWLLGGLVLAPFVAYELVYGFVSPLLYLVSVAVGLGYAGLIWFLGVMGEADVLALAFISLFTPPLAFTPCLSSALAVVLDSVPVVLVYALYNVYYNLRRGAGFEGYEAGILSRLYAFASMRYISGDEYRARRYMYAPGYVVEGGRRVIRPQLGVVDDSGEGFEGGWAVVYAPYVAVLAAGFGLYVLLVFLAGSGCPLILFLRWKHF